MVCPVCICVVLYELPQDLSVTASVQGHWRQAGEMRAFVCSQGHVFLCRPCDVRNDPELQNAAPTLEACAAVAA